MSSTRPGNPSRRALLTALAMGMAGGVVGYFIGGFSVDVPFVRARLEPLSTWDLLALPLLVLLVIAVHEAGHLVGGLIRGMRFLLYIVGPFQWSRGSDGGLHFRWVFNLGTFGGVAACLPDANRPLAAQMQPMILGGPLASLLQAGLGIALALASDGRFAAYSLIIAALSAAIFLATAIPMRSDGFMSDGAQWLEVRRGGEAVAERQRLTALMAQSMSGVRPAMLDAALIAESLRAEGGEPLRRVSARYFALLHAWDGGDLARAGEHADWLGAHIDDYPQGFRQSIAVELALFALLQRDDVDEARRWMARARGGVVEPSRRALADAALAVHEGRHADAQRALERARAQLGRGSDAGLAAFARDQIDALAQRLDARGIAA